MTTRFRTYLVDHYVPPSDEPALQLEFGAPTEQSPTRVERSPAWLSMRYQVEADYGAPFAVSLQEFLAFATLFEGVSETRVGRVACDEWLVKCYFTDPAVRLLFTASQEYRRHIRLLSEFTVRA